MPIVERLQTLAKERGTNFKQLEAVCGIGNGVIRRWDIQSPRLDKLIKVAEYLNTSLDYLVYGEDGVESGQVDGAEISSEATSKDQACLCDGKPLESEEADLIAMYRLLPDHKREDVFDIVHTLYQKHVERKRESIYWTYAADRAKQKGTAASDDGSQGGIA